MGALPFPKISLPLSFVFQNRSLGGFIQGFRLNMAIEIKTDLSNIKVMYETIFLTAPDLDQQEYEKIVGEIESIIKDAGGEITNLEHWGQKKLEYEINRFNSAYYTYIEFTSLATLIRPLERKFRYNEKIIRFLTVKVEKHHAAFNKKRREQGFGKKKVKE